MALNSNGTLLAVGQYQSGNPTSYINGGFSIYTRSGGNLTWNSFITRGPNSLPTAQTISFGCSVAISPDSTIMAAGDGSDNGLIGCAYLYTNNFSSGNNLSISSDSNTLAVGIPSNGSLIYVKTGTIYAQQTILINTGTLQQGLSLSADGNTIAMGSPLYNSYIGATWIFT